jgi:hypothetical protein
MYIPKINTTTGRAPITVLPDALLLEAYLNSDACAEDKELARWLLDLEKEKAGQVLRSALGEGGALVPVYEGLSQKAPKGGAFVCAIPDGALYVVKAA